MLKESNTRSIFITIAFGIFFLIALQVLSLYNYLLFHSIAELFSIVVACAIFILAWNSRKIADNDFLLFLGIAYLFVACIDLLHTLGYSGMNVFPGRGTNLPTQLWIAARYLESISLLVAPVFVRRKLHVFSFFLVYLAVFSVLIITIFGGIFPVCFIEGTGLTLFKKLSEYTISVILIGAFVSLYRRRSMLDRKVFVLLAISIVITVASEISFTFYIHAYGFSNLIGHFLKIASFYLIYKAVIEVGLTNPYRLLLKDSKERLLQQVKDRIIAEDALSDSEEKYKKLLEVANDAVFIADTETGIILEANKKAAELMGMPSEKIAGMHQSELHPPEEAERYRDTFLGHLEASKMIDDDIFVNTRDGRLVPVEISASVITVGNRKVMLGIFRDISDRKRSRDELERNYKAQTILNSLLSLALEDIPLENLLDQAIDLILSTAWLAIQSKGCIFLGEGNNEMLHMKAQKGFDDTIVKACGQVPYGKCLCGRVASTGELQFADHLDSRHEIMYEGITPHGHYCIPIQTSRELLGVMCLYVEEGHKRDPIEEEFLHSVASTLAGIIHHKRVQEDLSITEEQLRQSQKMEALGRLVGGIAHDFNNLLVVIGGRAKRALRGMKPDDPLRKEIEPVIKAEESATLLTRQLLAFARKQVLRPQVIDLNQVLSNLEMMLRRLLGEDVAFLTHTKPNLGHVEVDRTQIEQVIMNLVINARDAMPNGGRLTIRSSDVYLGKEHPDDYLALPGNYIMLEVSDTGCGMDSETLSRVFEPFFTTKAPGESTGLGLSMVYGIVRQSGGDIRVYSEPGLGTTFKIFLPRVEKPAEPNRYNVPEEVDSLSGTETILLVEDEDIVRELAALELRDLGYTVLEAANGAEALKACEKYQGQIHLVMTDVVMPGMSGPDLFKLLTKERPGVKVLYCSGYTERDMLQRGIFDQGKAFLEKPFTAESLGRKVHEVLGKA